MRFSSLFALLLFGCTQMPPSSQDGGTQEVSALVGAPSTDVPSKAFQVHKDWWIFRWHDDENRVTCYIAITDKHAGQSLWCGADDALGIKAEKTATK